MTQINPEKVSPLRPGQAPTPWAPLKFRHQFVETANERRALTLMENLRLGAGEGRFVVIWGQAGWGKSRFGAEWKARNRAIFIRMQPIWRRGSEMGFLKALRQELLITSPVRSIHDCYFAVVDKLLTLPPAERIIFLDEMDLVPERLELVRCLAEIAGVGFVLIGEDGMPDLMKRDRRLWSRTLDLVHFEPVGPEVIVAYGWAAAKLKIEPAAAARFSQAVGGGDLRMIRNRTVKLTAWANANKTAGISPETARLILEEEQRSRGR